MSAKQPNPKPATASEERELERQLEIMRDGAEELIGEPELRVRLLESVRGGDPLRVKFGVDPSAPDLHLGHTVVLGKLKRFQDLGHIPIFLIGDFTARIGDPSGRKKTRPALEPEDVQRNADTYLAQVGTILDVDRAEIRFNSEWMDPMTTSDFIRLCSNYTVARLLERDDFAKRYAAQEPIAVHEFLYPFAQSYDSVALRADVELGGTDQKFNLLLAREIQRAYGLRPQAVVTHTLLVGTDGSEKMSKSLGNAIGISEPPEDIYGKAMRVSDPLMLTYFDILSWGEWDDLAQARSAVAEGKGDPMALKHELAFRLVARCQGDEAAKAAREHFRSVVQRGEVPEELEEVSFSVGSEGSLGVLDILRELGFAKSNSEGRRLVTQGGVQVDAKVVGDPAARLSPGTYVVRAGKRRFARAILRK